MKRRTTFSRVAAFALTAIACCASKVCADSASLDWWYLQLDYGVFADGGNAGTPGQGPVAIFTAGPHDFVWSQEDGVAFAQATADVLVEILQSPTQLQFGGNVATTSMAVVGDNPDYEFELGVAQAWLDWLLVSVELFEPHWFTLSGVSVRDVYSGTTYNPDVYLLDPGFYDLELVGTHAFSSVWVEENESDSTAAWVSFALDFQAVSAPSCPADFDNSGDVDVKDLLFLLGAWGPCPKKGDCPADFDGCGDVGVKDLLFLLGAWGPCP